jgi:hypothetical protein
VLNSRNFGTLFNNTRAFSSNPTLPNPDLENQLALNKHREMKKDSLLVGELRKLAAKGRYSTALVVYPLLDKRQKETPNKFNKGFGDITRNKRNAYNAVLARKLLTSIQEGEAYDMMRRRSTRGDIKAVPNSSSHQGQVTSPNLEPLSRLDIAQELIKVGIDGHDFKRFQDS